MKQLIDIKRTVTGVRLTAEDWQLYDLPGRDEAALRLNIALIEAANAHSTAGAAWEAFAPAMRREAKFGACDSEGWAVAEWAFASVFSE